MLKKILLVDDDAALAEETAEILCDEGYCVEHVSDSLQGSQMIRENTYDIYLLDYKMTGLTGVDLLRQAKQKNPRSVVIVISGRPFIEKILREENVHDLVFAAIKKPIDIETLLGMLKALV
ncbi:MAG: response regulator [Candidatus Omnitrophica bacterium]|nr:response regulator [Candidatus Omnitrophota bacterium]